MQINRIEKLEGFYGAVIVPVADKKLMPNLLPENVAAVCKAAIDQELFSGKAGEIATLTVGGERISYVILMGCCKDEINKNNRKVFLDTAKAFKKCAELKAKNVVFVLDNIAELSQNTELAEKLAELPALIDYRFDHYVTKKKDAGIESFSILSANAALDKAIDEATAVAGSTNAARDLINHPVMYMTPERFAQCVQELAADVPGLTVKVYGKKEIEDMKMGSFLMVAKGAVSEPRFLEIRYSGGENGEAPLALVGKGIMYDSGGYSIKSQMATMYGDMAGAGAVVGAMLAIAKMKLPVNVVGIIAACENRISGDAYVPGDILFSMNGKTIQMTNSDAEGRLILVDALTYAVRNAGANKLIDIATLTGAARTAVGSKTAAILSNDDCLCAAVEKASVGACEKVWRLNLDEELMFAVKSPVADVKNSDPSNGAGAGTITAALFLREFVEDKPWVHVDIAPVGFEGTEGGYLSYGANGYGVSLLYNTAKVLANK